MNEDAFEIHPFGELLPCEKCGNVGRIDRFSAAFGFRRGPRGDLIENSAVDPSNEYLIIRCGSCGWEWRSETKDATP